MEIAPGQLVGKGRFEVLSRIGAGGAGLVYEVRDRKSDAHLALKTVRSIYRPDTLVLLKREFRAVQDLAHPNLVRLDELFEENGVWFFTMELVEGTDWLTYVRPHNGTTSEGPYESRVRSTLVQIVEALSALHATGTVHRDVKPSNVLVSPHGSVKLLDFGLAAQPDRIGDPMADGLVGTPNYMAPELLRMREPLPAGDFYAVGVMLYQALTGKFPFFEQAPEYIRARLSGEPTPVRRVASNVAPDLAELCDALLKNSPQARPTGAAILRMLGSTGPSSSDAPAVTEEFVGRTRELAVLDDAYSASLDGAPVTVVIEGASGLGKSALLRQFLAGRRGPSLVLEGRCHEREYVPYKGLDAIMDQLASHLADPSQPAPTDLDPSTVRLLPRLFPVLRNVRTFADASYGTRTSTEVGSRELRSRTYRAFRDLMGAIANIRPLVLAIDDVQWADDDTLELLGDMLAPPSAPSLLLVCTRRLADEGSEEPTRARLAFPGDVRRVTLGGLTPEEMSRLAARLSDRLPIERDELDKIVEESRGHPLFLQEIVRRRLAGARESTRFRLDEALWNRVSQLDEHERQIVEAVTVAGIPTDLDLIASAASIPRRDLPRHMATLRGANLVRLSGTNDARRVEAYHDRVREAVAVHLDPSKGRRWHERLAQVLETYPERDVDQLAVHWEGAGDAKRAAGLFREAADRASAALAFDRAVEFYKRALALGGDDMPGRAAVERLLAEALLNAGRGGEAGRAFLALAAKESDFDAAEFQRRAGQAFLVSGHFDEGRAALERAIAVAGIRLPGGRLSLIFRLIWYRLLIRLRGFVLRRRPSRARDEREIMRVDLCWSAAHGFAMSDVMVGAVFHALGARMSLDLGDPMRAARSLCTYAMSSSTRGLDGRRITAKIIRAARSLAVELKDPFIDGMIDGANGFAAFMLEDWRTALVHFNDAEVRFRDHCVGATYELDTTHAMKGRTLAALGRLTDLELHMSANLRDAIRRNDIYGVINNRTTSGVLLALARDDVAAAQAEVDESSRILSTQGYQAQHFYCLLAAGMVDLYRGKPEAALEKLESQRPLFRRALLEHVQSMRVNIVYLGARVHLALAAKDVGQARHLAAATRCGRDLLREGLPGSAALGNLVLACAATISGDERKAIALLRDVISRFDRTGMALHAAAARFALGGMVGGDEGRALVGAAGTYFDKQHVSAIPRFVELHAPGTSVPARAARAG
jgi:tetratricopeptide (TPR) repeat protein